MAGRAFAIWAAMLVIAITNGALRESWLMPRAGDRTAHQISTLMLCAAILLLTFAIINGALRGSWLMPRAGDRTAHQISTVILCAAVLLLSTSLSV